MSVPYRPWPRMMRKATAAAYCDLSVVAFEREVATGRLPMPIELAGQDRWSLAALDAALNQIESGGDWRASSPLYANG